MSLNYLEIVGNCFPDVEAYTTGDPTVYDDIIWISTPISKAELDASECALGTFEPQVNAPPSSVGGFHDQCVYGDNTAIENRFVKNAANANTSVESAPIAISSGEVVHVTISTKEKPESNFFVQVVTNAVKGGVGTFADGTQLGTDIEKPADVLDVCAKNLTGFNFNAGDRIAVYLKKGTLGDGKASSPVIRLFIRYD